MQNISWCSSYCKHLKSINAKILISERKIPINSLREGTKFAKGENFIIYKVMKYRKILMKYNVYFIFSLVKIYNFIFSLHRSVHITFLDYL